MFLGQERKRATIGTIWSKPTTYMYKQPRKKHGFIKCFATISW
jgi:hypothetical protein